MHRRQRAVQAACSAARHAPTWQEASLNLRTATFAPHRSDSRRLDGAVLHQTVPGSIAPAPTADSFFLVAAMQTAARAAPGATAPKGCYKCGKTGHWCATASVCPPAFACVAAAPRTGPAATTLCRARDCTAPQSQWVPRQAPPGGWPGRTPATGGAAARGTAQNGEAGAAAASDAPEYAVGPPLP